LQKSVDQAASLSLDRTLRPEAGSFGYEWNAIEDAVMADEKAKVLVVEDNAALSGVICFNLVRAGFQVTSATNGRQGLEMAQRGAYDLVLSDQQMPMMTGIQLCESLRQLPAHKRTPFILLTAKCMEIDFAKLQKNPGISAALPKPFSPSELVNCIEDLLAVGCRA
jgi:two-component system, chemotaxis family, chemotaxis protein CheY